MSVFTVSFLSCVLSGFMVDTKEIVNLCKRRGFVFQSSEIYEGISGFWDYGPLGILLKNNIRDSWWSRMVIASPIGPDNKPISIVGLDSSIIQHPNTWKASVILMVFQIL